MEDQSSMQPCRKKIKPYLFSAQYNELSLTRSATNNAFYGHSTTGAYLFLWPWWNFLHELWQIKWSQNLIYPTGFLLQAFWIIWKPNWTFYPSEMVLPGFRVKSKKKKSQTNEVKYIIDFPKEPICQAWKALLVTDFLLRRDKKYHIFV